MTVDATLDLHAPVDRDDSVKRRQIIEGARRVFLHSGFDAASMNEIARTAGVSKGTLYVYFDSKEALFEALIRQDKREQAEQTCRFDDAEEDLRSALITVGTRLISLMLDPSRIAQLRTVIAVSAKFPRIGQAYYEAGPRYGMERLAEFLRSRANTDALRIADYDKAAYHLAELCKSRHLLQAILCVDQQLSQDEILDHVSEAVDVFLRAYAVR